MQYNIIEIDNIYNSKTKEYVQEVITSYSIGNYRSAIVMLYSAAVCDMLFKLQELKDMYNDTVATEILEGVDKARKNCEKQSKSKWEWDLIVDIYKKTSLLDDESYNNLEVLYRYRNYSAHPAMNDNFELIAPSQEMTIALIKYTYKDILSKPPIFIKNIVDTLTEDLKTKNEIYRDSYSELKRYLKNKYYDRMTVSMRLSTLKAFWKFCFNMPDDENCMNNLVINRKALLALIDGFEREIVKYIKENNTYFGVATEQSCIGNLILMLSESPSIYDVVNEDVKFHIEKQLEKQKELQTISWFRFKNAIEYFKYVKEENSFDTIKSEGLITRAVSYFENSGEIDNLLDCFIYTYGNSGRYDDANDNFAVLIEPFLDKMNERHFEFLIKVSNENPQIYDRRSSKFANDRIIKYAQYCLPDDFDYSLYPNFNHSDLGRTEGDDNSINVGSDDEPEQPFII